MHELRQKQTLPRRTGRLTARFGPGRLIEQAEPAFRRLRCHLLGQRSKRKHIVLAAVAPVVFQLLLDCSCSSHFKLGAGAGRGRVPQGCEMTLKDVGRAKT